jgi:hypothetical protein
VPRTSKVPRGEGDFGDAEDPDREYQTGEWRGVASNRRTPVAAMSAAISSHAKTAAARRVARRRRAGFLAETGGPPVCENESDTTRSGRRTNPAVTTAEAFRGVRDYAACQFRLERLR